MSATLPKIGGPDIARVMHRRKVLGLAFLTPPAALFAVFTLAEGVGLEPGWWGHLLQLAAVVLLATVAWVRPRAGGPVLVVAGAALPVFLLLRGGDDLGAVLSAVAIVVAPVIVAGVLFTLAGRSAPRPGDAT